MNPICLYDSSFEQSKRSCGTSEHAKLGSWAMFGKKHTYSKRKVPEGIKKQ
jgi:hypothetical protein